VRPDDRIERFDGRREKREGWGKAMQKRAVLNCSIYDFDAFQPETNIERQKVGQKKYECSGLLSTSGFCSI